MDAESHSGQVHPVNPLHGRTHEEGSPEEEHHGKPSVMKRVRARARRFKDSITGHGHHNEPDNANDEEEEDDDEDEAQELVQDPEIHGAPMYESAAAKPFATREDLNVDKPKVKLGETLHSHGDPRVPPHVDEVPRATKDPVQSFPPHLHEPHAPKDPIQSFPPHLHDTDAPRDPIQTFPPTNYQTKVSDHTPENYQIKETNPPHAGARASAGDPLHLPEDPSTPKDHVPPANYQTKVTDPTHLGGEEAGIDAFRAARPAKDQTEVTDPTHLGGAEAGTDVFRAAQPAKNQTEVTDPMHIGGEAAGIGGGGEEAGIAALRAARPAKDQAEETKPTHLGGEEPAIAPMISSFGKMDVRDEPENSDKFPATGTHDQFSPESPSTKTQTNPPNTQFVAENPSHEPMNVDQQPAQQGSYTDKISFATSAITDKAIQAKNAVASKLGYGGDDVTPGVETHREAAAPKGTTSVILEKAASAKDALASKVGYGGNAGRLTSETHREGEPVSGYGGNDGRLGSETQREGESAKCPTSAIVDGAKSAKDVIASKLGYGGNDGKVPGAVGLAGTEKMTEEQGHSGTGAGTGKGTGVVEYGRQMSATVTEKLAPVYGKVAGAGSAIASKIPGRGTQTGTGSPTGTPKGAGAGSNMKGYLSEKMKPGEDDKALSEVISEAFHKTKKEEVGVEEKPLGKVTESAEVAKRLGTESDETAASGESPGQSYVGMLKGAVTSWFGKGGEMNPSQAFVDHSQAGENQGSVAADTVEHQGSVGSGREERKIQESTN